MKTRVSVVVLCYNEERRLGDCLRALKRQTVQPHEIIVVDNNSTDESIGIARSFGVKVIHEKKQGIGYARNAGFNAAKGDVIARIDADSVADEKWVEAIAEAMQDSDVVAVGGVSYTYELRWLLPLAYAVHGWFNKAHERRLGGLRVVYGFNLALRSSTWQKIGPKLSLNTINEDIEFSISVSKLGRVERCQDMVVGNRLSGFLKPKKMWRYWRADGEIARQLRKEAKT